MRFSALAQGLGDLEAGHDPEISGITDDSRGIAAGRLFVAIQGTRTDGHAFLAQALAGGAAAVAVGAGRERPLGVPCLVVADPRKALAEMAARFHNYPASSLDLIGFTGTFGKTTTSHVLRALLEASGVPTATLGSLGASFRGRTHRGTGLTTPAPIELHATLRTLLEAGARTVVMEVTSHALLLERVAGLTFAHAIVGAITPGEHTDFHRTYAEYVAAKARMLTQVSPQGVLAYDRDNAAARGIAERADVRLRAGLSLLGRPERSPGDVTLRAVTLDERGATFSAQGHVFRSALLGHHNVRNAGVALMLALALGVEPDVARRVLEELKPLRRRMESFVVAGRTVLDDTAGHPDSLAAVFEVSDLLPHDRLLVAWVVRGSRGPAINARNAAALADLALLHDAALTVVSAAADVTAEKDRATAAEIDAARDGFESRGCPFEWHDTLRGAIARVAARSRPGDLVLLLGAQGMDDGAGTLRWELDA